MIIIIITSIKIFPGGDAALETVYFVVLLGWCVVVQKSSNVPQVFNTEILPDDHSHLNYSPASAPARAVRPLTMDSPCVIPGNLIAGPEDPTRCRIGIMACPKLFTGSSERGKVCPLKRLDI